MNTLERLKLQDEKRETIPTLGIKEVATELLPYFDGSPSIPPMDLAISYPEIKMTHGFLSGVATEDVRTGSEILGTLLHKAVNGKDGRGDNLWGSNDIFTLLVARAAELGMLTSGHDFGPAQNKKWAKC